MSYLYAMGYYSTIKKMKTWHMNNMGGSCGYYFKWNKSDGQIPYDLTHHIKNNKFIDQTKKTNT